MTKPGFFPILGYIFGVARSVTNDEGEEKQNGTKVMKIVKRETFTQDLKIESLRVRYPKGYRDR